MPNRQITDQKLGEEEFEPVCSSSNSSVNTITINYHHPIPRLDDMLNELYDAIIFTKINLKSGYH